MRDKRTQICHTEQREKEEFDSIEDDQHIQKIVNYLSGLG